MLLFFINALWNVHPSEWMKQKWWLWGLSWVGMYAISYFWSSDLPYWEERAQVKLPFLMLPLAIGCLPTFSIKQWRIITFGISALLIGGCIYSLSFFFADRQNILDAYFKSKVFPTPAYKDHIRYSIFVAWAIIWNCYMYRKLDAPFSKAILILATIFFTLYLHILAVRSGLLVLYSFSFLYLIYVFLKKRLLLGIGILAALISGVVLAYQNIPSFKNKIGYMQYSYIVYKEGNKSADFSDIGRLISYDLAGKIIKEHPLLGVGAGDIREEMKKKYEQYSPATLPEQRIVPHNQIMEVTMAGGIVTLILFLVWLFYPLKGIKKNRPGFYRFATWFALFMSMMVEPMLEVQFGVFVYLFCLLCIQKATEEDIVNLPEVAS